MDQRREKREWLFLVIYTFDMHIYTTHLLKLGMDQRREKREWLFLVIYTFDMHIYTTHLAKVGNGSEKRKEGVVIPSHLYI